MHNWEINKDKTYLRTSFLIYLKTICILILFFYFSLFSFFSRSIEKNLYTMRYFDHNKIRTPCKYTFSSWQNSCEWKYSILNTHCKYWYCTQCAKYGTSYCYCCFRCCYSHLFYLTVLWLFPCTIGSITTLTKTQMMIWFSVLYLN